MGLADVFISYKSEERSRILPMARALEALGYTVWWDRELAPGDQWVRRIKEELDAARCVVVVWTCRSVAKNGLYASEWIGNEAGEGHRRGVLVPVLLDKDCAPFQHKGLDYANLTDWSNQPDHPGFRRFLRGLVRHVGERTAPADGELSAWAATESMPGAAAYKAFASAWPDSPFAAIARARATEMEEADDWAALGPAPRLSALSRFLRRWHSGRFADEAEARIEVAEREGQTVSAIVEHRPTTDPMADLRETWRQFPARDDIEALDRFLTRVRSIAPGGGLEFEVQHHLERMSSKTERHHTDAPRRRPRVVSEVVFRARAAALAGEPIGDRTFRIDIPGLADWPMPEMVALPTGRFQMGSPAFEQRWPRYDGREEPVHDVDISYPMAIAKHPVTVDMFAVFVSETSRDMGVRAFVWDGKQWLDSPGKGWRDPGFPQDGGHPVTCVSWTDAQAFVSWLNHKLLIDAKEDRYRLPSEAEWEYACRAGSTTAFSFGPVISPDQANYNSGYTHGATKEGMPQRGTVPVDAFAPNAFGLRQMHGNVWEWCEDVWNDSYARPGRPDDGRPWMTGDTSDHVLRGGAWHVDPHFLRSASRSWNNTPDRTDVVGFRLARSISHASI